MFARLRLSLSTLQSRGRYFLACLGFFSQTNSLQCRAQQRVLALHHLVKSLCAKEVAKVVEVTRQDFAVPREDVFFLNQDHVEVNRLATSTGSAVWAFLCLVLLFPHTGQSWCAVSGSVQRFYQSAGAQVAHSLICTSSFWDVCCSVF